MKTQMPTKQDLVKFLIYLQDNCGYEANVAATKFLETFNSRRLHQKFTRNPDSAYPSALNRAGWGGIN